jgi:S1-C subfamily serine protease
MLPRISALFFALFASLVAAGEPPAADPRPPSIAGEAEISADLRRAMDSVVLLLVDRPDGKTGYGAGVVLDDHGLVLTSRHVVAGGRGCHALLHDPARPTYTPLDGGITRLLAENQGAEIACATLCSDEAADLALVRLAAETPGIAHLTPRATPARLGETVLSVGHPEEAVWSFTRGVVGAVRASAIQHDAAMSFGSSGGPLLDAEGRLLGINAFEARGPKGFGFARPIGVSEAILACPERAR